MSERPGPHVAVVDPDTPADPWTGLEVCRTCHLLIRNGDPRHDMPDVPEQVEARRWAGEREDDD